MPAQKKPATRKSDKSPGKDPKQHWPQQRDEQQSQADPAIEGSGQRAGFGKGQQTGQPDLGENDEPRGHAHSGGRG